MLELKLAAVEDKLRQFRALQVSLERENGLCAFYFFFVVVFVVVHMLSSRATRRESCIGARASRTGRTIYRVAGDTRRSCDVDGDDDDDGDNCCDALAMKKRNTSHQLTMRSSGVAESD